MNSVNYLLPVEVEINGESYPVRSDYRAILDIITALTDPELSAADRAVVAFTIFYEDYTQIPAEDMEEAAERITWFLNCGQEENQSAGKKPKLVDWSQDFHIMVGAINQVAGKEIRAEAYLHWWTFVSLYSEISGDCYFANVVRIRNLRAKGKKLDKADQQFYRDNAKDIDFRNHYTESETEILKEWLKNG